MEFRFLTRQLRRMSAKLPEQRRDWVEAIAADADQVPAGSARLRWLLGGYWLVLKHKRIPRSVHVVALGFVAAVGARLIGPDPFLSNAPVAVVLVMLLASLFGPRRPEVEAGLSRLVRVGGYAAIAAAMLALIVAVRRGIAPLDPEIAGAVQLSETLVLLALMPYAYGVLVTSSASSRVGDAARAAGTGAGLLTGLAAAGLVLLAQSPNVSGGAPWLYLVAVVLLAIAAVVAGVRTVRRGRGRIGQALAAGLLAGGTAALVAGALSFAGMAAVPGLAKAITPTSTGWPLETTVQGYLAVLLVTPVAAAILAVAGAAAGQRRSNVDGVPLGQ